MSKLGDDVCYGSVSVPTFTADQIHARWFDNVSWHCINAGPWTLYLNREGAEQLQRELTQSLMQEREADQ